MRGPSYLGNGFETNCAQDRGLVGKLSLMLERIKGSRDESTLQLAKKSAQSLVRAGGGLSAPTLFRQRHFIHYQISALFDIMDLNP